MQNAFHIRIWNSLLTIELKCEKGIRRELNCGRIGKHYRENSRNDGLKEELQQTMRIRNLNLINHF
jgi:hypothetical protein